MKFLIYSAIILPAGLFGIFLASGSWLLGSLMAGAFFGSFIYHFRAARHRLRANHDPH